MLNIGRDQKLTKTQKVARKKFLSLNTSLGMNNRWYLEQSGKRKKYLFGCPSKECLRAYFGGHFKPLFQEGYRVKRYKVPDEEVVKMGIEVAFPVKYHKLGSTRKLNKVLRESNF